MPEPGGQGSHCPPPNIWQISQPYIPTGGGQIIPTYYYWHPQFFSPSGITVNSKLTVFSRNIKNNIDVNSLISFRFYMEGIVTTGCTMDFSKYPYDSHRCKYIMGSTGFADTLMRFDSTFTFSESAQRPLQYSVRFQTISTDLTTEFQYNFNQNS